MKTNTRIAILGSAVALMLGACGGSSNSSPPPMMPPAPPPATPPATPPPAAPTAFTAFVLGLLGQTNETASPVDINGTEFTFSEDANAFNSVLGGP